MASVVASLITDDNVEPLGKQIDNLAFAFIAPLGADDRDDHSRKPEIRDQPLDTQAARLCRITQKPRLDCSFNQATLAALMCLSSMREIACSDVAPTTRSSSLPFLKRIKVGIPLIP